ncbi:lysosomal Pro-X carboxypeptidase [Aplysia californica]|uniref:Lysosomal Pro-X carboxypeptidase n=1 Tax=Aplysia californica TaxID=6500 RepID=A0ABM0JKF4_APLCA|nr:lysosomal Pro-X carboxypeptidase [Aplysia californica]
MASAAGLLFVLCSFVALFVVEVECWRPGKPISPIRQGVKAPLPSGYSYQTLYYDQQIDHFGFANEKTFKQKYLFADQFWNKKGPIFFYTGNEGTIEWFCNNTGFLWDIAPQFNALLVFAEHRYYGDSLPFGKESYQNSSTLNFLTSEQALADFATLIRYLKATVPHAADKPVVAFGGSYGGMLAAWFRIKYPNVVVGSLAASAPIWEFTGMIPCSSFYDTTSQTWYDASKTCGDNLHRSYETIKQVAAEAGGYDFITDTFKLCTPLKSKYDLGPFMSMLVETYTDLAMVDYPYPASFMAELPGWPVAEACSYLSQPLEGKDLLRGLSRVTNMYFNYTGTTDCVHWNGSGGTPTLGYEGWDYQSCTEMVMPMCSNGSGIIYNIDWNFQQVSDACYRRYKTRPRENWISLEYWAKELKAASNIIFSNGMYDPWSSGGVLQSISETVVAIQIPRGAHHLDLRAKNPKDTREVIAAREQEINIIKGWLGLTP